MIPRSILIVGAVLTLVLEVQPALAETPEGASLRVDVSTFKSQKGTLRCSLFSSPAAFPDGEGTEVTAPVAGTISTCTFVGVAPGTYAIAVFHDENGNGKLDKAVFGLPVEGYGVSNNRTYALSSPKWEEAKFTLGKGQTRAFTISLRY